MSILTKLYIEDHAPLNVLESQFSVRTPIDHAKRPQGVPVPGLLTLTIEAAKEEFLWPWATATLDKKQVELHYIPATLNERTRKLFLSDVHLVGYRFNFKSTGEHPVTLILKLAFAGLEDSITDSSYSAHWRETYPMPEANVQTLEEETTNPEIISCRYTDLDGNTITELYEDTVILEVDSKDCVGKIVDIDLSDDEFNFKYKGKVLKNDLLEGLKITADKQKVELDVFFED